MRLCAVSIDLDGIDLYRAIHGLPPRPAGAQLVYEVALGRALEFARSASIPLTLFAIGRDLSDPRAAEALRRAAALGHSAENHSLTHRYDLCRCEERVARAEIRGGADAIAAVTGRRPRGFRAPGYLLSDRLLAALRAEGVAWDSSLLPAPGYYLAKLGALAALRLGGRRSASLVGDPRLLRAPRGPYRPALSPHRPGGEDIVELPLAVTRRARWPVIGTSLAMAGRAAGWLIRGCLGDPVLSLGLHGVDFLDRSDGLGDLSRHQPDLRRPIAGKLRTFAATLTILRQAGYRFVSCDEARQAWERQARSESARS